MYNSSNARSVYKIIVLYIGAVIGAGFASGQEIMQFFIIYGSRGLWGIVLATALFSYLGAVVMLLAAQLRSSSYNDIYRKIMGNIPGRLMDCLSLIMLPGGLVVMLAGGGAVFSEHLGLPGLWGTLLVAAVTMFVISRGLQGVVSVNSILVPLKVIVILLICIISLIYTGRLAYDWPAGEIFSGYRGGWAWSALLYVSYNMVVPVAVLSSLGKTINPEAGVLGGLLGGLALGAVAGVVVVTGICFYPAITRYEVPLLYMAGSLGTVVKTGLGALIWLAILTTAIADTHGFASRFAPSHTRKYRIIGIGTVLLAVPVSGFKFSMLVKVLYPLFGYAGLILLFALLFTLPVQFIRRKIIRKS